MTAPNGAIILGSLSDPDRLDSAAVPVQVRAGETLRSAPVWVPRGSRYVSLEIEIVPSAACSAAVVIRSGNRLADVLPPPSGEPSASVFDDFSAPTQLVWVGDATTNYIQIDVTPDVDATVLVVGSAR